MDFAVTVDHTRKIKESEKRDKYQDLARKLRKLWNMRVMAILIVISTLGSALGKIAGRVGSRWTNRDHLNYSITKIRQKRVLET